MESSLEAYAGDDRCDEQQGYGTNAPPPFGVTVAEPGMVFSRQLHEGIRRGRIRCSIRIWMRPHVKAGGRYPLGDGHIVVDSIESIEMSGITDDLARESGFDSVADLLEIARHGRGDNVYLIRFHYLRPGAWDDTQATNEAPPPSSSRSLLQRIRGSAPPAHARGPGAKPGRSRGRSR